MYYSYVMGVSSDILKLKDKGFIIEKDKVTVTYYEPYENKFVFHKNRAIETFYNTQYGTIHFEVHTSSLKFDGGVLEIKYSLYISAEKQADYKIILKSL